MATSDLKSLPAQARKRIETLESKVSELTGALGLLVSEMQRQGLTFPVKRTGSSLLKTIVRDSGPVKAARKVPSFAQHKAARTTPAAVTGLAAAVARGEAAKVEWVNSGEVVPARTLADLWGLTPQALGPAAERGEVFAIVVKRQRYYPREFLELDRNAVGAVSKSLGSLSPSEKLIFWKRQHGALGGKTVLQALTASKDAGQLVRAVQLAQAWADEAHAGSDVAEAA
jgi:hypothetical protein